jgi:hypothetical protein
MKNNLRHLGLLMLLLVSFSCKNEIKNKEFVNKLSSVQNGLPSPYFNYYLYFEMDNGQILETNIYLIYALFEDNYSKQYSDFSIFLEKLITQKEIIKTSYLNKYSKNNYFFSISKVEHDIEVMNEEEIKKNYLEAVEEQSFNLIPKNLKPTQIRTILYKMFVDGYIISPNDLVGYYKIAPYKSENFK